MSQHASTERNLSMLAELAQMGVDLARRLTMDAGGARSTAEAVKLADAFCRVSDEVRACVFLEAKLRREAGGGRPGSRAAAPKDAESRAAAGPEPGAKPDQVH